MPIEDFVGKIIEGDCLEVMKKMPENSVDAIVTDPPAGISFMGKEWDSFSNLNSGRERNVNEITAISKGPESYNTNLQSFQNFICQVFTEAIKVLKPGGHALVWAIPRTSHHTAMGLERAGFEIRDCVTHIFGSGFPKSLNIGKAVDKMQGIEYPKNTLISENGAMSGGNYTRNKMDIKSDLAKQFEGLGTALKPAVEFWWLCRKPLSEKTIAENCLKWGTGGLSIDECRIGVENISVHNAPKGTFAGGEENRGSDTESYRNHQSRFPANLILECICDEVKEGKEFVSGSFPEERGETAFFGLNKKHSHRVGKVINKAIIHTNPECPCYLLDRQSGKTGAFYGNGLGGASRFFYCAKASRSERNMGCEELEDKPAGMAMRDDEFTRNNMGNTPANKREPVKNNHPTVKPLALMEYLVKLISREGQIVLDPFAGSGSTLIACEKICRKWIGIEKESDYIKIAKARIKIYKSQLKLNLDNK